MSVLTTISPITSSAIITTPATSIEDIDNKILPTAVSAQKKWASTSLAERKAIVAKYIELLKDDETATRLGKDITKQMGRPVRYTKGEISTAALRAEVLLGYADEALAPVNVDESTRPSFKKYLTKDPLGVILIIFPWNYPYLCLTNGLIPALLAGNSVLIKPSPQTPNVANEVAKLFKTAGLPDGVLQVVHSGDVQVLEGLVQRKAVAGVVFTGSVEGGLAVQKAAAGRTIPIALELGGNDPAYVRSDVKDIKATAEDIVDGAIFNSGQSCCSIERVYVDEKVYDQFVDAAVEIVKGYKLGDPFDESTQIGPVISEKAARGIRAQIKDAVDRGAKKLIPSETFAQAEKLNPTFVAPQILVNLDETSRKYLKYSWLGRYSGPSI
ncbi:aldehyde dehydrogenase (NADP(+)) ALD4 [Sugiyamaella lignohabitans]|uniref:Aldehyde dehydrogenase (NADP(+)) ALD4 n=1 Tax=Sugiyamaella lignohabitans TaxID=796027 RepID=A0A167CRU4_9ASCO|nr:aldehyde dehydrogenase (NADP(+)) ALD4 [Sugiyamaella lignohabitans]ANB12033.1 aldehyde dehydrogenase (NADP(+)) ALD4 [Sugiyamaella lignohabitans]